MNLISMTDFVLAEHKNYDGIETTQNNFDNIRILAHNKIINYANFLKEHLKLGMFIPCDENDVPLDEPTDYKYWIKDTEFGAYNGSQENKCIQYQQAKERVLFDGFHSIGGRDVEMINSDNWICFEDNEIMFENEFGQEIRLYVIEDLLELDFKLTNSAIKQLNL